MCRRFVDILERYGQAIHGADRKATVVSAGVISDPVNRRAEGGASFLRKMLKSKKVAKAADVIAVHPYTAKVKNVEKNIAVAVISISSTPIKANAFSIRRSSAGASHAALTPSIVVKSRYNNTP